MLFELKIDFDDALCLIDFYNHKIRQSNRLRDEEVWAIANKSIKEKGKEWASFTLKHNEKLNELAKKSNAALLKNGIENYNSAAFTKERKELNDYYDKKSTILISEHKNKMQINRNNRRYIKQLQNA